MSPSGRLAEAGFLLVEAVVAVGIVAVCAGAALAAVIAVTGATARAAVAPALTRTAQNVLTDLRAATAYDPRQLQALAGTAIVFDADEPSADGTNRRVRVTAAVTHQAGTGAYTATVTASMPGQTAVSVTQTLVEEAPAPGSTVAAAATAAPASPPPDDGATGPISL